MSEDLEPELVTASAIAERAGVGTRHVVHMWTRRDETFPRPVPVAGAGERLRVWRWDEVRRWLVETGRLEA